MDNFDLNITEEEEFTTAGLPTMSVFDQDVFIHSTKPLSSKDTYKKKAKQ